MKKSLYGLLLFVSIASGDFIRDDSKEVVLDASTNLLWQDNNESKTLSKNWADAINYCEELELGGYSDWRLPNFNELYGLLDKSKYHPALSSAFQNVWIDDYLGVAYWSSTNNVINDNGFIYAWAVEFDRNQDSHAGEAVWGTKQYENYYRVRCVRGGM